MIGFEYYNPAKIVFGEDSEKKLKSLLSQHKVSSLLLVYSGDFITSPQSPCQDQLRPNRIMKAIKSA